MFLTAQIIEFDIDDLQAPGEYRVLPAGDGEERGRLMRSILSRPNEVSFSLRLRVKYSEAFLQAARCIF